MTRRDVQAEILSAVEQIAAEHGFAGVTTKEVARVAGCSQGSIYNHFQDRSDLLAQLVASRVLAVAEELGRTGQSLDPGRGLPLGEIVRAVAGGYQQLIALSTSLVADPEVRARFNAVLEERGASPDTIDDAVTSLISSAQAHGSVRTDVDAGTVAFLITGTCHQAALHRHLAGHDGAVHDDLEERLTNTLESLLRPA